MGIIIGKFRQKKSTYEVLEKLENEITSIEEFGRNTELRRRKIIRRFIFLAVLIYMFLALILYFFSHKFSANQTYIYVIPLIAFPIIVYLIKNFLAWYYSRKLRKNEQKLVKLKDEKKKILDNVMETETYKVAKKILDKFGNEPKKLIGELTPVNIQKTSALRTNQTTLRQRNVGAIPKIMVSHGDTWSTSRPTFVPQTPDVILPSRAASMSSVSPSKYTSGLTASYSKPSTTALMPTPLKLPRPILPKERSVLDKMVDYLVGDGPANRFALICKKCYSHNGMAFKEEYEYLSFRCPYCSHFNPAPKKRFSRPNFDSSMISNKTEHSSDSDVSGIESDAEGKKLTMTELRSDSPDTEKNSDFDKLSDLELKEEHAFKETAITEVEEEKEVGLEKDVEEMEVDKDDGKKQEEIKQD